MIKSSWFVALLILVAVLVCGGCAAIIGNQFATNGNVTATAPAALIAEVATMEPTAIPSPTVDTVATQIVLVNQIATQQAEINAYQEQIRQINIEAQALETRKIEAQAAIEKSVADKARADADKAAQDAILADIELKKALVDQEEIEIKTAMVSAVAQQKQAETGRITNIAMVMIVAAFVVLGAIAMFRPRAQLTTDNRDQEIITKPNDDFLSEMIPATMIATADGSSQFEHAAQITRDEWYTLRRAAVALGGLFSRRKLDGSNGGEKYFTDTRAREILAILQAYDVDDNRYGQPHTNDMTLLTAHGWAWLKLNPAPCPTLESAESGENTAKTNPTPPQNTEGEVKSGGEGA